MLEVQITCNKEDYLEQRGKLEACFAKLNLHLNVNLKHTLSILQLYFRSIVQAYFSFFLKKKDLWPIFMDIFQLNQGCRATKKRPICSQYSLVLIRWTSKGPSWSSWSWNILLASKPASLEWQSGTPCTRPLFLKLFHHLCWYFVLQKSATL